MNLYSFGDSFTMGLGMDKKFEESNLGEHPDWDTMTDEQKNKQRSIVANFWKDNCFTKLLSDKLFRILSSIFVATPKCFFLGKIA